MPVIKKRVSGKKKQQPAEEIKSIMHDFSDIASRHKKLVTLVGIAVLAIAIVYTGYALLQASRDATAAKLLAEANEIAAPLGGIAVDRQASLDRYREIADQYSGTMSAAVARYYAANSLAGAGRSDEALKEYQKFIDHYSRKKVLLGFVYQRMGYLYSGMGKSDEAIQSFSRAEELTGIGLATLELAKLYDQSGKKEASQQKYKEIVDTLPSSLWAMDARTKLPPPTLTAAPPPPAAAESK